QTLGKIKRRGTATEIALINFQGIHESLVPARFLISRRQLIKRVHEGFRRILAAERTEVAGVIGLRSDQRLRHKRMNSFTFSGSFLPGATSTPLQTSTPQGCTLRTASTTLLERSPPERMTGRETCFFKSRARSQSKVCP